MTAPDPAAAVAQQFFGAGGQTPIDAPAGAPSDAIVMYKGASHAVFPWAQYSYGGWWAWDLRSVLLKFVEDLLRVEVPAQASGGDANTPFGFRDSINDQHLLALQNNYMLKALCKAQNVDLSGMPGS